MTESAYDRALKLLGRRPHLSAELRRKLAARGYEVAEVEKALAGLAADGYLDDAQLVRDEVERLRGRRGLGRAAIAARLGRRGAIREDLEAALAGVSDEEELETARQEAGRWLRGRRPEGAALARHLSRRGFGSHAIFRVLKELVPDDGAPSEVD